MNAPDTAAADAGRLRERVLRFIADPAADSFDDLAMALFRRQAVHSAAYRKLMQDRGVRPEQVGRWQDIPAVSTVAFKTLEFHCGSPRIVFRTSGTTRGPAGRGAHYLAGTTVYEAALRRQFRRWVLPDRQSIKMLAVAPSPEWAPDSSLGFMIADVMTQFGDKGSGFFLRPEGLDMEGIARALDQSERRGIAVALLGVAFGFVHLLDQLRADGRAFRLPPGSRIMDTGGFKGRSREVLRSELLAGYAECLGIPPGRVVNEYGMTELSSQFYDTSLEGGDPEVKRGPHWVRTRVIDPATGNEAASGRTGILEHLDLANVDSVIRVETEDLGFAKGGGFVLLGRASGAEPRGCSIPVDLLLEKQSARHLNGNPSSMGNARND